MACTLAPSDTRIRLLHDDSREEQQQAVKPVYKEENAPRPAEALEIAETLAMRGGDGEGSYAKNSSYSGGLFEWFRSYFVDAVDRHWRLPVVGCDNGPPALRMADLGCATGENTTRTVAAILNHVKNRYLDALAAGELKETPEVEVFFSDLPSNDFNSLFRAVPTNINSCPEGGLKDNVIGYFSAGVPGSFYRRLFAKRSTHIVSSIYALHWLSRVPEAVADSSSPAYNKGRVGIHRSSQEVAAAYAQQARSDLCSFLAARAEELVSGGLLVLIFLGRDTQEPLLQFEACRGSPAVGDHFLDGWNALVADGLIEQETLDSFNLPVYCRSLEEMREAVEESDAFHIHFLDHFTQTSMLPVELLQSFEKDPTARGKMWANISRSLTSHLVEAHLGRELASELYDRLEKLASREDQDYTNHLVTTMNAAILMRK